MINESNQLRGIIPNEIRIRIQCNHIPEGGKKLFVAINRGKGRILLPIPI